MKKAHQESVYKVILHIQLAKQTKQKKNLFNLKDTVITFQIFIQRHIYEQNLLPKSHIVPC